MAQLYDVHFGADRFKFGLLGLGGGLQPTVSHYALDLEPVIITVPDDLQSTCERRT